MGKTITRFGIYFWAHVKFIFEPDVRHTYTQPSLFFIPPNNLLRRICICTVDSWLFPKILVLIIILNSITMALDVSSLSLATYTHSTTQTTIEVVVVAIFLVEMFLIWIARGVIHSDNGYFRDNWNYFDFFVIVTGILSVSGMITNTPALRVLRLWRPLRILKLVKSLRVTVNGFLLALPALIDTLTFFFFILFVFALIGVQFYHGKFRSRCLGGNVTSIVLCTDQNAFEKQQGCEDPSGYATVCSLDPHFGSQCPVDFMCVPKAGPNPAYGLIGYDNIGMSLCTVFQVTGIEGWTDILYVTTDAASKYHIAFYIALLTLGSFFCLNLIKAVICIPFALAKKVEEERLAALVSSHPSGSGSPQESTGPTWLKLGEQTASRWVRHVWFNRCTLLFVLCHSALMSTEHYHLGQAELLQTRWAAVLFYGAITAQIECTCEILLRLRAMGVRWYCRSVFRWMDPLLVLIGLINFCVFGNQPVPAIYAIRLVCFIYYNLTDNSSEQVFARLFKTLESVVKDVGYFAAAIFIFLFVFALLGMELFREDFDGGYLASLNATPYQYIPSNPGFSTFGLALTAVFQVATGENWNTILFTGWELRGYYGLVYVLVLFILLHCLVLAFLMAVILNNFNVSPEDAITISPSSRWGRFLQGVFFRRQDTQFDSPDLPKRTLVPPIFAPQPSLPDILERTSFENPQSSSSSSNSTCCSSATASVQNTLSPLSAPLVASAASSSSSNDIATKSPVNMIRHRKIRSTDSFGGSPEILQNSVELTSGADAKHLHEQNTNFCTQSPIRSQRDPLPTIERTPVSASSPSLVFTSFPIFLLPPPDSPSAQSSIPAFSIAPPSPPLHVMTPPSPPLLPAFPTAPPLSPFGLFLPQSFLPSSSPPPPPPPPPRPPAPQRKPPKPPKPPSSPSLSSRGHLLRQAGSHNQFSKQQRFSNTDSSHPPTLTHAPLPNNISSALHFFNFRPFTFESATASASSSSDSKEDSKEGSTAKLLPSPPLTPASAVSSSANEVNATVSSSLCLPSLRMPVREGSEDEKVQVVVHTGSSSSLESPAVLNRRVSLTPDFDQVNTRSRNNSGGQKSSRRGSLLLPDAISKAFSNEKQSVAADEIDLSRFRARSHHIPLNHQSSFTSLSVQQTSFSSIPYHTSTTTTGTTTPTTTSAHFLAPSPALLIGFSLSNIPYEKDTLEREDVPLTLDALSSPSADQNAPIDTATTSNDPQTTSWECRNIFYAWRVRCRKLISHTGWDYMVMGAIFTSCVCLAIDSPNTPYTLGLRIMDIIINVFFTLEMIIKITACGFWRPFSSYLRNPFNVIDFLVVVSSWFATIVEVVPGSYIDWRYLKAIRALRAFRPLRFLVKFDTLRLTTYATVASLPRLVPVFLLIVLMWFLFALASVQLFKGRLQRCEDMDQQIVAVSYAECMALNEKIWTDHIHDVYEQVQPVQFPLRWTNPPNGHFDNIGSAMLIYFELSTLENWPTTMFLFADSTAVLEAPRALFSASTALPLFVIGALLCGILMLNLLISVMVNEYSLNYNVMNGRLSLTPAQRLWLDLRHSILLLRPGRKLAKPGPWVGCWKGTAARQTAIRRKLFVVVETKRFKNGMKLMVAVNALLLCFYSDEIHFPWKTVSLYGNVLFIMLFCMELLLKLLALGKFYFASLWNRLDFVLTICGLAAWLIEEALGPPPSWYPHVRLLAVFGIARMFRLLTIPRLKRLHRTLMFSLPGLTNVGIVLLLMFFIYAVLGMNLWGRVKKQVYLNQHANFDDFPAAMLMLFRSLTGENWNGVMREQMIQPPECNDDDTDNVPNDCGSVSLAVIYWVTFQLLCNFLLLNVFVAVILQHFENEAETAFQGDSRVGVSITKVHLKQASVLWEKLETRTTHSKLWSSKNIKGRNFLHVSHLGEFINSIPGPLGKKDFPLTKLQMGAFIKDLLLPQHNNCVHYVDAMCALTYAVLAESLASQSFEKEVCELPGANEQHQLVLKETKRYYPELFTAARAQFTAHDVLYVIFIQARWRGVLARRGESWKPRANKRYRANDLMYWLHKGSEFTKSTKDQISKTAEATVNLTKQGVNLTKEHISKAAEGMQYMLPDQVQPAYRRRTQQSKLTGPNQSRLKRGQAQIHLGLVEDEYDTPPTHIRKLSRGRIGQKMIQSADEALSFQSVLPTIEAENEYGNDLESSESDEILREQIAQDQEATIHQQSN